jgi:hypothetical protein
MTTYLDRLGELPPSETLLAFRDALRKYLIADRPGIYAAPEAWGRARDDREEAWKALSYQEKQLVRECGEGQN